MKPKITFVFALLISALVFSQSGINYKAIIKDGGGNILASQSVDVQFIIYEGAALTNNVYQESHPANTNANGIIQVNIGEGTTADVFTDVAWGADEHWLNVQVDTGSGLVDMGTTQFMAVPYALHATNAATRINDLNDAKSDVDGTQDGSSIFLGINAGISDSGTDNQNIGIGYQSLSSNTVGIKNIGIGNYALENNIGISGSDVRGDANVAIGNESMRTNIEGYFNTTVGSESMFSNDDGARNVAFGYRALYSNMSGPNNTASGFASLGGNIDGQHNTAYGSNSVQQNNGDYNVGIGSFTLWNNLLGNGNVALGYKAGYNELGSNKLYIHNDDMDENNALIYGEFDTNILRTNSQFQIGNPVQTGFAFPLTDGTSNQILQTDGNGTLIWVDNSTSVPSGLEAIDEGNGIGYRLVDANPVYYGNIGDRAVDLSYGGDIGYDAGQGAIGTGAVAMGQYTTANTGSVAMGYGTSATGQYATAMGSNTTASGPFTVAMGESSTASGLYATAIGFNTDATGQTSTAMGLETEASGLNSTTIGNATNAVGENSFATGELTTATGKTSTAMGNGTNANGLLSTAIGRFNVGGGSPTTWVDTDPLFEIGNGSGFGAKANALTVLKNGDVEFDGEIHHTDTGSSNLVPIAYGSVDSDNTILGGTNNFSVTRVNTGTSFERYRIGVFGKVLNASNTTASVLVSSPSFCVANVTYGNDYLYVSLRTSSTSDTVFLPFQFVMYQQ